MCGRHCACEHFGSEVREWSFAIMSPVYWRGVIAAGPNAICGPTLDQFVEIRSQKSIAGLSPSGRATPVGSLWVTFFVLAQTISIITLNGNLKQLAWVPVQFCRIKDETPLEADRFGDRDISAGSDVDRLFHL